MPNLPDPDYQPEFYAMVPLKRLIAWIIDTAIILALSALVVVLTFFTGLLIWPLLYLVVGFAYRVLTIAAASATPGMLFAGIEFRSQDGARFDGTMALVHTFGYSISLAFPVLQVISILMMLTTSRAQGLTDAFLGTVALNRRAAFA